MMPAFSPGPCTTRLLRVGSRLRCTREDLYEQCSLHITLKMPSSVSEGSRPRASLIFSYSGGVIPCSSIMAGVMADAWVVDMLEGLFSHVGAQPDSRISANQSCRSQHLLRSNDLKS